MHKLKNFQDDFLLHFFHFGYTCLLSHVLNYHGKGEMKYRILLVIMLQWNECEEIMTATFGYCKPFCGIPKLGDSALTEKL
jgi:hypothetical protein